MSETDKIQLQFLSHRDTGLWMATSKGLPGFVVHAHSRNELINKLPEALRSFSKHTTGEDAHWFISEDEVAPGYDPPTYIAHRELQAA